MDELFQLEYPSARLIRQRLKEAREAMALSMTDLANLIDVTPQAVSQYESGDKQPEWTTLAKIAASLEQPINYFTTERPRGGDDNVPTFFRSFKSRTKTTNKMLRRWREWASEIVVYVDSFVNLPQAVAPMPPTVGAYTEEEIENIAQQCRRWWGLADGPINNMVALLESKGFVVVRAEFKVEDVDGFSCWQNERPFIFLVSDKNCAVRSRFDAAHELAHIILHRHLTQDQIEDPEVLAKIEDEANRFAASFLLPAKTFLSEIFSSSLDQFVDLKRRWKVSIATMLHRCKTIGLFEEQQFVNLRKQLSFRKWVKAEPLDDEIGIERPMLLRNAIKLIVDAGMKSVTDLLVELRLSANKLSVLVGCDETFWNVSDGTIAMPQMALK